MAMMCGGMLYFPLRVNLFDEVFMELVEARFGLKGTAAVMKLECKIYKENGYYLVWNEEQCTLFTNKVGKGITEPEMQGIVDILVEKGFFDRQMYNEQHVLTSMDIQKIWMDATKRRKRDISSLPFLLIETGESDKVDTEEIRTILRLSDYGKIGDYVWKMIHQTHWSKISASGKYMIAVLAKEKKKEG